MRFFVLLLLFSATYSPVLAEEVTWKSDGWLATIGLERLDKGDEFGCYGMPDANWEAEPVAVTSQCRQYLGDHIEASRWGGNALSVYTPDSLSASEHEDIADLGFMIHGDNTGLRHSAWHHAEDEPKDLWDWHNLGRRGGSLELGMANQSALENELDAGGLVNLYWIGRIHDAIVRHDKDVVAMLEERDDVWFTTWGEAWSYWSINRCHEFSHELNGTTLVFTSLQTPECQSLTPFRWNVPITWIIDLNNSEVQSINLPEISSEENQLQSGWRVEQNLLYLSVQNGFTAQINLTDSTDYDILGRTSFFNNHSTALTITGHSTTDLFSWSKRFDDHQDLRFTWLVMPQLIDQGIAWLPAAAVVIAVSTLSLIFWVVKKDLNQDNSPNGLIPDIHSSEEK